MKIPLQWLKEYVDVTMTPIELGQRLTMAGLETSDVSFIGREWDNIFVAHVDKVQAHPNADRLRLATVNLGQETITVVCGGPNLAQGQKVAFAKLGAKLKNPESEKAQTLKAIKIRGFLSEGMVCSERELGLGEDASGILILDENAPTGTPLSEYLGDTIIVTEVTPNRPDWLSLLGVAYEVAAINGAEVKIPRSSYNEESPTIKQTCTLLNEAPDLARRYTASLISGVTIGASPQWMKDRLTKVGLRPINNIVDITNYVMLEYGQPLHAFDFDTLDKRTILVRRAKNGESLTTIDGIHRKFTNDMLVIADGTKPVAVAGVMGGAATEVSQSTTNILLESANFKPESIRRTSASLEIKTEASYRFERNLNSELASAALKRATALIQKLAGGTVSKGILDSHPGKSDKSTVILEINRIKKVLGVALSTNQIKKVLTSLGFNITLIDQNSISVRIPYWRSDISIEEDLIEELARTTGYERIPATFLATSIPQHQKQPERELREKAKDLLVSAGLQEIISYSITAERNLDLTKKVEQTKPLRLRNPMSPEQEFLRTSLRGSLLATLEMNQRYGQDRIGIFEVGRVYLRRKDDLPEERDMAVGALWGGRAPLSWVGEQGKVDFFDAKGVVESFMSGLELEVEYVAGEDPNFHPGRTAYVKINEVTTGVIGELRPDIQEELSIPGEPVALFELNLATILQHLPKETSRFESIPRFPGSYRDLSLLADFHVPAARLESLIKDHELVNDVTIFDVYVGSGVPEGKRSIALRIHFKSPHRTLTSKVISDAEGEIMNRLVKEVGVELRS